MNKALPDPYYARLEMRSELGVAEDDAGWSIIVPDVVVQSHPQPSGGAGGAVAVVERPRRQLSESSPLLMPEGWVRHHFVEIRDAKRNHKLITLIEILSPSNKRPGPDRAAYAAKQDEVLSSDASLIEIDLLRSGERILPTPDLARSVARLRPRSYLVLVSRAWDRDENGLGYHAYPFGLRDWMPCVPVPLRQGEEEVPLDLQYAFNQMYEGGPYRRAVNYAGPPEPPLSEADARWAAEVLAARRPGPQATEA